MLARVVDRFTQGPLLDGNRVTPLIDGDEAFPEMIAAIDAAERSVALASYIFSRDAAGLRFVDALERACQRGVVVRVLVDGIGALYSLRPIRAELARRGIPSARFLFSLVPWRVSFLNLRNHRKLLIVDGRIGFTGGMNLRRHHVMAEAGRAPVKDVHFRIDGPVVAQMMEVFADDWWFTTREDLTGEPWFPPIGSAGPAVARGIAAGPHEEQPKMQWTLFGAVAEARRSVRIVTPYFLPDESLMTVLRLAAMGGVEIDIVLPAKNNLPLVAWAAAVRLDPLLEAGCRLWLSPPPFDHAKLMVVDGVWSLFGSSNWDPRSLRLNFEYNVEAYDVELAGRLQAIISERIAAAQPLTREALKRRRRPFAHAVSVNGALRQSPGRCKEAAPFGWISTMSPSNRP